LLLERDRHAGSDLAALYTLNEELLLELLAQLFPGDAFLLERALESRVVEPVALLDVVEGGLKLLVGERDAQLTRLLHQEQFVDGLDEQVGRNLLYLLLERLVGIRLHGTHRVDLLLGELRLREDLAVDADQHALDDRRPAGGRHRRSGRRRDFDGRGRNGWRIRSEEHTSELQSRENLVCRLLLEK